MRELQQSGLVRRRRRDWVGLHCPPGVKGRQTITYIQLALPAPAGRRGFFSGRYPGAAAGLLCRVRVFALSSRRRCPGGPAVKGVVIRPFARPAPVCIARRRMAAERVLPPVLDVVKPIAFPATSFRPLNASRFRAAMEIMRIFR